MKIRGHRGTKFGRQTAQRQALLKGLADSLVLNGSIETTLPKAKAVARYTDKLVGKAKKGQGNLHSRRQVISGLASLEAAHRLVDELAPKLDGRDSGYFRVQRTGTRQGDRAQMAKVSFVDDLKTEKKTAKQAAQPSVKDEAKAEDQPKTTRRRGGAQSGSKVSGRSRAGTTKRTGVRGNR